MTDTGSGYTALGRIDKALLRLDGVQARVLLAQAVTVRTGMVLPVSALLVFEQLEESPKRVTDLAEVIGTTQATVSRQIQDLERKGLVSRMVAENDGRAMIISLTARGREVAEAAFTVRTAALSRILDGWDDEDREQLAVLLERVLPPLMTTLKAEAFRGRGGL